VLYWIIRPSPTGCVLDIFRILSPPFLLQLFTGQDIPQFGGEALSDSALQHQGTNLKQIYFITPSFWHFPDELNRQRFLPPAHPVSA